ncbi:hypothetical protein MRX96_038472 [Rhipicephalus microplus]
MTSDAVATHRPPVRFPLPGTSADEGENSKLADAGKDAEGSTGGTHDTVGSSTVVAPQDDNESADDAYADAGLENINTAHSLTMVEKLNGAKYPMTSGATRRTPVSAGGVNRMSA